MGTCGASEVTLISKDWKPLEITTCVLPIKYELNNLTSASDKPKLSSFFSNLKLSSLSSALEKSVYIEYEFQHQKIPTHIGWTGINLNQ